MIDLSPEPQEKSSEAAGLHAALRPDAVPGHQDDSASHNTRWWRFPHEGAEAGVQMLSRWAGPVALLATLAVIGWLVLK